MHKLAELCVRRPVFATVLILSLVVIGLFSFVELGVDRFPNVDFPFVTVSTRLVGAAPEEIETEISDKIEEAVNTISGIDQLISISSEGTSVVTIGFELSQDGRVVDGSIRMVDATGGDDAAIRTAFEAGRRAILRCQNQGYPLPPEKYEQWKRTEIVFDPSKMRLR